MKIGILGVGTVGGGVVNILVKNDKLIKSRVGVQIEIVIAAVKNITDPRICDIDTKLLTQDVNQVVNHPEVEVVIELIGGIELAKSLVERAINNGKHVITANKALIATHGNMLFALANAKRVALLFEASVTGGIPIIKSIQQGLSANKIEMLAGIINGTCNFVLTEMAQKNRNFSDALKEAQTLGYAEADPTFDVEGIDAAHKLTILSALSFGGNLALDKVVIQGITHISQVDIAFADELGYCIKHLAIAKNNQFGIQMRVHPTLILKSDILGQVDDVMNAILVKGNCAGQTMYYGAGAGSNATASAVVADLVDLIRGSWVQFNPFEQIKINYIDKDDIKSIYYLRLLIHAYPDVLVDITRILSQFGISIRKVIQHSKGLQQSVSIAIITNIISTRILQLAVKEIQGREFNQQSIMIIRVEELK